MLTALLHSSQKLREVGLETEALWLEGGSSCEIHWLYIRLIDSKPSSAHTIAAWESFGHDGAEEVIWQESDFEGQYPFLVSRISSALAPAARLLAMTIRDRKGLERAGERIKAACEVLRADIESCASLPKIRIDDQWCAWVMRICI